MDPKYCTKIMETDKKNDGQSVLYGVNNNPLAVSLTVLVSIRSDIAFAFAVSWCESTFS